jgi:pyridoxine 5-phosphate synthase
MIEFEKSGFARSGAVPRLSVNIDHIATLRQARKGIEPDPVAAAVIAELAGAEGIIAHLREDRRHIQDRDLRLLREIVQTKLNLEMAATEEMRRIALEVKPDFSTLVPEKREELTTEGGLEVASRTEFMKSYIARLQQAGITVSLFIDPDEKQIAASRESGADWVELHTGAYANAKTGKDRDREFEKLDEGARHAANLGLRVGAGHGLNYVNARRIAGISAVEELNIGHSIISRAALVGLDRAVREMRSLIANLQG